MMKQSQSNTHQVDAALLAEAQEIAAAVKDPDQFTVLYDRYYIPVFRYLFKRTASQDEAADLCSQTFTKALLNLKKYEFKGFPFSAWLFRIARNELNQFYRKSQKNRVISLGSQDVKEILEDDSDDHPYDALLPLLSEALRQLKKDELELVEMKHFEHRSYKEIGEIMDLSEGNARIKVHRAMGKLRTWIQKHQSPQTS